MKKTVSVNISGLFFHIDEDAYDRLNRYLAGIKRYFAKEEGRDEIISDIESRIAELLQKRLTGSRQVVNLTDVDEVVKLMGEPIEMESGSTVPPANEANYTYRRPRRLFRDPENKMIAGVASGMSAYFNLDPVWMRLLFVISIFLSGAGIIAYIILWIIVPEAITTADRLEMRGEPVNISNIEKSIKEEFGNVKDRFNKFADSAKSSFNKSKK
jgi:phage shock protein PspC (stress-responsive transcriptional regulator)